MTIFNLEVSKYGIDLQTYFGDLFLYHRAWMLALVVVAALLVAKIIRKRNYQQREVRLLSNPDIWSD
jgi:flagellar biogenesis protein FliO